MSTWEAILADIRIDLKDTGATPRFSDDALYLWAKDAIRDYSLYFPLVKYAVELAITTGSYALPSDFLEALSVEYPQGRFLDRRMDRPPLSGSNPTRYYISQGRLYLDASPTSSAYLTYNASHPVPAASTDSDFEFTIPPMDEELIRLYVKAKAAEQIRTSQANLDRFKLGSGDRQDNPLIPEVDNTMKVYRDKVNERLGGKTIMLHVQR